MAGTNTQAQGLPSLGVLTLYAVDSSIENSLNGLDVNSMQEGNTVWVAENNCEYKWYQDSLEDPSDPNVIIPLNQNPLVPGRWLLYYGPLSPPLGLVGLSNVVFVDGGGTGTLQNGAIFSPFRTVTEGIEAARESGGVVMATPGDYSEEDPLDLRCFLKSWVADAQNAAGGAGNPMLLLPDIRPAVALTVQVESAQFKLFQGDGSEPALNAVDCTMQTVIAIDIDLTNCNVSSFDGAPLLEIISAAFGANINCKNCNLTTATLRSAGTTCTLLTCNLETGFTFEFTGDEGELVVDDYTAIRLQEAGWPITNARVKLLSGQQEFCRIWVNPIFQDGVPGARYAQTTPLAAGAIVNLDLDMEIVQPPQIFCTNNFDVDVDTRSILYGGPLAHCKFSYDYAIIINQQRAAVGFPGVRVGGQSPPMFLKEWNFNQAAGTRLYASGGSSLTLVADTTVWPAMRMSPALGLQSGDFSFAELGFVVHVLGQGRQIT